MATARLINSLHTDRSSPLLLATVAWGLIALISLGRKIFPWRFFLIGTCNWSPVEISPVTLQRSFRLAGRCFPRPPNCLNNALAARALLSLAGRGSRLWFGANRPGGSVFQAHAWLECDGFIICGQEALARFVPLCYLDESGRLRKNGEELPGV